MSKPIKNLITKAYQSLFADIDGGVLIDIRGVESLDNSALRGALAQKGMRVTVVKNTLAKKAFADTTLEPISEFLDGPSALVYGGESVVQIARELIEEVKKYGNVEFKGAIMEGVSFGPNEIEKLSKYPTRDEAQAQVIQVILGPAGAVIGAATSAGSAIASILSTIEEKLESGETIAKIA